MPRPEISEETKQKVEELTDGDFNVPDTKVSFEDRLRVLAQKYATLKERQNTQNQMFGDR